MRPYLLLMLTLLAGCQEASDVPKDSPKPAVKLALADDRDVAEIELLEVGEPDLLNDELLVRVKTKSYNGCWGNLEIVLTEHEPRHFSLTAYGVYQHSWNVCPENLVREDTVIRIASAGIGEYYFQANQEPLPVLLDTLRVE